MHIQKYQWPPTNWLNFVKIQDLVMNKQPHVLADICNKLFCPKPEIQHDWRGRGVPTLTWEEVTIREGKRRCCSCTKKDFMSLRFHLKVIYKSACEELCILQCQQRQKVGVGTMPNARKNPYLVLDFYVQDWRWTGSIFNSYLCDLVLLYWFLSGDIFSDSISS